VQVQRQLRNCSLKCAQHRFLFHLVLVSPSVFKFAVGCCLAQADESGAEFPTAYGSQRLTASQVPWSTVEKEAYAIIWAVSRFRTVIFGSPITVYLDHNPLRFLTECAPQSARLTRWALALQEYLIDIKYKKGSAITLADGLSRL